MTCSQAQSLKNQYESKLLGKPIGKYSDCLIDEIKIKEIFPNNYEVVLEASIDEGIDSIHRTLKDYLEENEVAE